MRTQKNQIHDKQIDTSTVRESSAAKMKFVAWKQILSTKSIQLCLQRVENILKAVECYCLGNSLTKKYNERL